MKQVFLIILIVFFAIEISFSEVFKWVDEKGAVHFTDDITQIPEKYRPQANKIELPEDKEESKAEVKSAPPKKEEPYKDRLGRGEKYWKERADGWRRKLSELQRGLEILRVQYNELTVKFNDSKSTAERGNLRRERDRVKSEMDQYKNQN